MTGRRAWRAVGAWTPAELAALSAGLVVFGYVGWDSALWDARLQLVLHLLAAAAIAGLVVLGMRGGALPRTRIDLPVLGLLAAFALATASAMNVGMSLRAMGAIVATAAMLPVALVALRHRPSWVGMVTAIPVLAYAVPTLAVMLARRVDWIVAGAPGLPPIRLLGEGTPFGSVAVPPFVIWPAWAMAGLIEPPWIRRAVRIGLVIVGVPLTILSGSRSAWLAIGATLLLVGTPWLWRRRHRLVAPERVDARAILIGIGLLVAAGSAAALVLPRLTAVTSLIYRASLWRDTLNAWNTDPLLGIGPGFMPYARQAAAPDFSFPVRQPHSHNLPLGVLGDAGIVGLVAAVALVIAIGAVAGPWRSRTVTGRSAAFVLIGLGIGGLFEDLTFLPNFNLLALALLAVALSDAGAVTWRRPAAWPAARRVAALAGVGTIAVALGPAWLIADAGAVAHRAGADAAARAQWPEATERFTRAAEIDPWHPGPPKALAVAADAAGRIDVARRAAERAVELNPGDGPSWTNLALLCAELDDRACQERATERAVANAQFLRFELINAALSYEALGNRDLADDAYGRSLASQRLTALATDWPRAVEIDLATVEGGSDAMLELNRLLASWAMEAPIEPPGFGDPAVRSLAHAIRNERSASEAHLEEAIRRSPDDVQTWQIALVLRDAWGAPIGRERRAYSALAGGRVPRREPPANGPALTLDIASFRAYPGDELVEAAERLRTDPAYPWILQRTLP